MSPDFTSLLFHSFFFFFFPVYGTDTRVTTEAMEDFSSEQDTNDWTIKCEHTLIHP